MKGSKFEGFQSLNLHDGSELFVVALLVGAKLLGCAALQDGTFEEVLGAVSACEFKPKHLRKPGDVGYVPPK
eukprot:160718-Prorocentrum_minimum.AAC.2